MAYKPLLLTDAMPYGKHKGELIGTIIEENPEYIRWCLDKCNLRVDREVEDYLTECER